MTRRRFSNSPISSAVFGVLLLVSTSGWLWAEPSPAAVSAFNSYIGTVESRLAQQHRSQDDFLAATASDAHSRTRLRQGEPLLEQVTPATGTALPGAMLHHWRGTAFIPGAKSADFERLLKDFNGYPKYFAPEVLQARVLTEDGARSTS
jgi:hypothetical protein